MQGLNEVTLMGTVGSDPETNIISDSVKVSKFRMATNDTYKDKNGNKKENTEWHNIEAWGFTSDLVANYVKKGQNLLVKGRIKYDSYEDKQFQGRTIYRTKIVVDKILFVPSPKLTADYQHSSQQPMQQQPVQQQPVQQQPVQQQPVQQRPVQQQPMQQQPVQQQPVQQQPMQQQLSNQPVQQPVQQPVRQPVQQPVQQQVEQYVTGEDFMNGLSDAPDDLPF